MYYPEELIDEIREKNRIEDVISGYVRLKKQGSNFFGLCPFHNEESIFFGITIKADLLLFWMWSWWECNHLCYGI